MLAKIATANKQLIFASLLLILIPSIFWGFSRYPDLVSEFQRASHYQLLERQVGKITKDVAISAEKGASSIRKIFSATLDWLDANKYGMSFGILFGAALLAFLQHVKFLQRLIFQKGYKGGLSGMLFGVPLGVCTNCATPIGLAMRKKGASIEAMFSSMVASPMLNPIGLLIILMMFPWDMFLFRLFAVFILVCFSVIVAKRISVSGEVCELEPAVEPLSKPLTWTAAFNNTLTVYLKQLWRLIKIVVPVMLLVAFLSAIVLEYYSFNQLVLSNNTYYYLALAVIIGTLLPIPMFVDIIIVLGLWELGVDKGICLALLICLPAISAYSAFIIWKNVSKIFAITMVLITATLGFFMGVGIDQLTAWQRQPISNTFVNIAHQANVAGENKKLHTGVQQRLARFAAGGAAWTDYNNDGWLDLYVAMPSGNKLYRNNGKGQFDDVTKKAGVAYKGNTWGVLWGDYDNDGDADLLLVNHGNLKPGKPEPDILYRNNGDGTFSDVTKKANLHHPAYGAGAAWGDYNNDGYLDLYVANWGYWQSKPIFKSVSQHNKLFLNNRDGTFTDVTKKAGVAGSQGVNLRDEMFDPEVLKLPPRLSGSSFQPIWFDYNNDNHLDLFVSNEFGASTLYKNHGNGQFTDVTKRSGILRYTHGMGVAVVDYNQDGYWDLYEGNNVGNSFWVNQGNGSFKNLADKLRISARTGFTWGVAFFDYDNDGDDDIYIVNGEPLPEGEENLKDELVNFNLFYQHESPQKYIQVSHELGLTDNQVGRGLAIADYNNDGQLDLFVANKIGPNRLFKNSGNKHHWLNIKLVGTKSNRDAIGAVVTVISNGKRQSKLRTAGSSFFSQNSPRLHFGVGAQKKIERLIIRWPSGIQQELRDIPVNQHLRIKEPFQLQ